ncbi:MAG: hypothetical protein QXH63_05825, partial [Pyrobaculum sp.]
IDEAAAWCCSALGLGGAVTDDLIFTQCSVYVSTGGHSIDLKSLSQRGLCHVERFGKPPSGRPWGIYIVRRLVALRQATRRVKAKPRAFIDVDNLALWGPD